MKSGRLTLAYAWFVWLAQGIGFATIGGLLIFRPDFAHDLLPGGPIDEPVRRAEIELVELFAPVALGLGLLTLQVLRPSFSWMRGSLASAFNASWLVALGLGIYVGVPHVVLGVSVVFALGNLLYARRPDQPETPYSARPDASAEAPMLGRFWAFQMLYYLTCGVLAVVVPHWLAHHLGGADLAALDDAHHAFIGHIFRFAAALYLAMGLISHYAIGAQTDETWRTFCRAFLVAQWACALAMVFAVADRPVGAMAAVVLVVLPNVLMGLVNTLTMFDRCWIRRFMDKLRTTVTTWWIVQALLLIGLSIFAWMFAEDIIDSATAMLGGSDDIEKAPESLAEDGIRLIGPLALGTAFLTVVGVMRRDRRSQHAYARLFVLLGVSAIAMRLANGYIGRVEQLLDGWPKYVIAIAGITLTFISVLIWLFPDWRTADLRYQGAADTKPRWVYRMLSWQTLLLGALAVITAFMPELIVDAVLRNPADDPEFAKLLEYEAQDIELILAPVIRSAAPFWLFMAGASAQAAASSHEWSWRGLCRWFSIWQSIFVLTFVYVFDSHLYNETVLLLPTALAGFAMLNVWAARSPLCVDDLAGQPAPSGWLMSDAGAGVPMALSAFFRRARPYHRSGVGAVGRFEVAADPALELPELFAGSGDGPRSLLCTVRFSNRHHADDAGLDSRGCALRIRDPETDDRLDLLLSTGAFGPVSSTLDMMLLRWAPAFARRHRLQKDYAYREAAIAGLRRAPTSYALLHYHSQLVRLWLGRRGSDTGAQRCRLRLVPIKPDSGCVIDEMIETGLPDVADQDHPWLDERRPENADPPDYLRAELAARLDEAVHLMLQIQISEASDAEDATAWYDASVDWPLPWRDVGVVILERALSPEATESLYFDSSNGAGVIMTPHAPSWRDPRSLAVTQDRVMRWVGELRRRINMLFGRGT